MVRQCHVLSIRAHRTQWHILLCTILRAATLVVVYTRLIPLTVITACKSCLHISDLLYPANSGYNVYLSMHTLYNCFTINISFNPRWFATQTFPIYKQTVIGSKQISPISKYQSLESLMTQSHIKNDVFLPDDPL